MEKSDNIIHVKLDYDEALQAKRDVLTSEIDIINIKKSINRFVLLRDLELKLKSDFYREIKKIVMNIKLLEANLPQVKVPKLLKHPEEEAKVETTKSKVNGDLEYQLRDIQKKLKSLSY